VGANAGFYSLLAAANGCQVVAFDPQPACVQIVTINMCLNAHFPVMASGDSVAIVDRPVSDVKADIKMVATSDAAGQAVCNGQFSVDQQHKAATKTTTAPSASLPATAGTSFTKRTVSLDDVLLDSQLQLHLVKIDTEGFELPVLRSMRKLLAAGRVAYLMVEVTPLFWARDGLPREDVYAEFLMIMKLNCTIQRALDVNFERPDVGALLDTEQKLREYLVVRDFVQEDLLVSCPTKAN
jgi:FkbM family methyltransferase